MNTARANGLGWNRSGALTDRGIGAPMRVSVLQPACVYLPGLFALCICLCLTSARLSRVRARSGLAMWIAAVATNVALNGAWPALSAALLATLIGAGLLLVRVMGAWTCLGLSITATALPIPAWPGLTVGLALAGVVAWWQIRKVTSPSYVRLLAWETFAAIGLSGAPSVLGVNKPDLSRLPLPEPDATNSGRQPTGQTGAAAAQSVPLLLLVGLGLAAITLTAVIVG